MNPNLPVCIICGRTGAKAGSIYRRGGVWYCSQHVTKEKVQMTGIGDTIKAICPGCAGIYALKKDGTMRKHTHYPTLEGGTGAKYWYRRECEGSGQLPRSGFRADRYRTWVEKT